MSSTTNSNGAVRTGAYLYFSIEVGVPFGQAAEFAETLTGDDRDVVLAAETAMRERLEESRSPGDYFEDEVELSVPNLDAVRTSLAGQS